MTFIGPRERPRDCTGLQPVEMLPTSVVERRDRTSRRELRQDVTNSAGSPRRKTAQWITGLRRRVTQAGVLAAIVGLSIGGLTSCASTTTADEPRIAERPAIVQTQMALTTAEQTDLAGLFAKTAKQTTNYWRDASPFNEDGTVNAYIEIPEGVSTKFEYDIGADTTIVDRELHPSVGNYPVNYGFVPGTFGYDGDPFDALILGPPLKSGEAVNGVIAGVMYMDDEKGSDPKVIISAVDANGKALYELTTADKARLRSWFDGYKKPDAHKGKWSKVTGFGDADAGRRVTNETTNRFQTGLDSNPQIRALKTSADARQARPLRVLVTGFEPFDGREKNMSEEVAAALSETQTSFVGVTLDTLVLPVAYEQAADSVKKRAATFEPDLIISLGESKRLQHVELEQLAKNACGDKADCHHETRTGPIVAGAGPQRETSVDLEKVLAGLVEPGMTVKVDSCDGSGGFVCNDTYFRLLETDADQPSAPTIFVHVPITTSKSIDEVTRAVRATLKSALDVVSPDVG